MDADPTTPSSRSSRAADPVPSSVRTSGVRRRVFASMWSHLDGVVDDLVRNAKDTVLADAGDGPGDVVVEIGAGRGSSFSRYRPGTRVVAFEPNHYLHADLLTAADRHRIELDLRAHDLRDARLAAGSVTTVVSILTLCSVPDQGGLVREIHRVLAPGGRFRFVEHVAERDRRGRRLVQRAVRPAWRLLGDGCDVCSAADLEIARAGFARVDAEIGRFGPTGDLTNRTYWGVATR